MSTLPNHWCIRCGIAVYEHGAACRSCVMSDPALVKAWQK